MRPERERAGARRPARTRLWIVALGGLFVLGRAAAGTLRPQDEALFRALGGIDPAAITEQFLAGADVNAEDEKHRTPLILAAIYWRKVVGSAPSPRNVGAGLRRVYFLLPGDFRECLPPGDQPKLLVLGECVSHMSERILGVSISWAPEGATVQSVGPREGLNVGEAEWQRKRIPIGRYALSGEEMGGIPDPEVWIGVVPLPQRPLLVRVWAPQEYGEEAGWTLRGVLGSLRQPSPVEQLFALPLGRMATGLGRLVGLLALLGTGLVWLLLKRFPELRPLLRLTPERKAKR